MTGAQRAVDNLSVGRVEDAMLKLSTIDTQAALGFRALYAQGK